MSDQWIGLEVWGIEELRREMGNWPVEIQNAVVDQVNAYVLDNIKKYPPYMHVKFKDAYGDWFSEKQRKYVMARISEGSIRPGQSNRSQRLAQGWKVIDKGIESIIVNEVPYAGYVMGDSEQARMHKKIGWDTIGSWINKRMSGIITAARKGLVDAVNKINSR